MLAAFAANLDPDRLPAALRAKLGHLLLDHLRVCSIGERLPWSDWARRYVAEVGRAGRSHVMFSAETLNPQHAVFLNVTYGSSFDADDTHVGAMLHPGVAVWSTALAIGEEVGAGGRDILAAVVAGYEIIIRTGLAVQPSHFRRGFQSTGTCDVFGTAATAGRLLFGGADREQRILDAIGLAGGYASGLAQYYYSGATGKRIQAAHAAQSGVAAALLTRQGFGGPPDILEGTGGFGRAYADGLDASVVEDGLGERFHIGDVLVKSHAAAARVHAGMDAMFALREAHGFGIEDIESMRLGIPRIIQGRLTTPHPVDLQAAQMCLPFSVAVAAGLPLEPGRIPSVQVADYERALADPRHFALEDRTSIELDDEVEAASGRMSTGARVAIRLRDGRSFESFVAAQKGAASNPFAAEEHERRFVQELTPRIGAAGCEDILAMSRDLDRLDPVRLGRLLSGKG
jgi:2-methylcitrate dehydratase PrpD